MQILPVNKHTNYLQNQKKQIKADILCLPFFEIKGNLLQCHLSK